ncbi:MAG: 23S rRNA pseudouridine(1911/1915/1917) synthase RluD [Gammaproteobacteria bacterium]
MSATVPNELAGKRLDQVLAILFPEHSRARLQEWIRKGDVHINHGILSQRRRVKGGELVVIDTMHDEEDSWQAENIPLQIIYEDKALLIINKPAGIVVHPGAGNPRHTILNALLHHDAGLKAVPRAGIIQRLDKDTSGLMVIARAPESHTRLTAEMQARKIKREYQAIVSGVMTGGGSIDLPIGRHPHKRTRMTVTQRGKPAVTHYRIKRKFPAHTHILVQLETGRTHQIRVHLAHLRHPLVGDPVYGVRRSLPRGLSPTLAEALQSFHRQALHAHALTLRHPVTHETLDFKSPLPEDMMHLLNMLDTDARQQS